MERLTKWEGHDPDGKPRAVLAKRDGNWNDNIQEALRKLANWEDCEEALAASFEEESIHVERLPSVNDMHDRAEAEYQKSFLTGYVPNHVECKALNLYEMDERVLAQKVQDIIDYIERSEP